MRSITLVIALSLAFAAVALAPVASASDPCGTVERTTGLVECGIDPCAYRSDCCGWTSFWCPETE